ncbi:MAG: hypothetical protein J5767_12485 [Paludibacteraceae bacterium]|nr:hypothetical protein [Paludibacteraceae bacterium]
MKVQANLFIPVTVTRVVTVDVPSDWDKKQILNHYLSGEDMNIVDDYIDTEDPVYDEFNPDSINVEIATAPYDEE